MSIIHQLGQAYTLSSLSSTVYSTFGPTSLVIAIMAFIGLIGYIASLPMTHTFSHMDSRLMGIKYFNSLAGIVGTIVFLWLLFSNFYEDIVVFFIVLIPSVAVIFKRFIGKAGWSFKDFSDLKLGLHPVNLLFVMIGSDYPSVKRNVWAGSIVLIALIFDLFLFALVNLSLPLVMWIIVIYFLATVVLESAYDVGFLNSILTAEYYKVTQELSEGKRVTEGFVTRRDSDHIFLMTRDGTKSLFTSTITEMSYLTPSELDLLNKKMENERTGNKTTPVGKK